MHSYIVCEANVSPIVFFQKLLLFEHLEIDEDVIKKSMVIINDIPHRMHTQTYIVTAAHNQHKKHATTHKTLKPVNKYVSMAV